MSMEDRQVLVDTFSTLSLRDKCAVARALQLQDQLPGAAAAAAVATAAAATAAAAGSIGGEDDAMTGGHAASPHGTPVAWHDIDVRGGGDAGFGGGGGGGRGGRHSFPGGSVPAPSPIMPHLAMPAVALPALGGAAASSVAAALSLMSTDERLDCEHEASRIQSNVRAWLVRRNYDRMRSATRTLQRAIRRMLERRRRDGDADGADGADSNKGSGGGSGLGGSGSGAISRPPSVLSVASGLTATALASGSLGLGSGASGGLGGGGGGVGSGGAGGGGGGGGDALGGGALGLPSLLFPIPEMGYGDGDDLGDGTHVRALLPSLSLPPALPPAHGVPALSVGAAADVRRELDRSRRAAEAASVIHRALLRWTRPRP